MTEYKVIHEPKLSVPKVKVGDIVKSKTTGNIFLLVQNYNCSYSFWNLKAKVNSSGSYSTLNELLEAYGFSDPKEYVIAKEVTIQF